MIDKILEIEERLERIELLLDTGASCPTDDARWMLALLKGHCACLNDILKHDVIDCYDRSGALQATFARLPR